ncbi:MAG: YhdH/YhfP family quinone oxidoreductase [Halofilum sp. (in: g-proteobacteria)]|nr:YhdH/YhfP family quinone oxidoreductase [Halofilum sp. (in: g-proteobacteria)]
MTDQLPTGAFRAFRLREDGDGGELTEVTLDTLDEGEVVLRAHYSSVNYKDALAGTGRGKIARKLPLVGGIDVAGTVVHSDDSRFAPGDEVLVTGCGLSEDRDGGYAEYVRARGEHVIPLPAGMDTFTAMALGTAGFTAGLALVRLQENGLTPELGPVAVTGATGGVGGLAIDLLHGRGYEAVAVSGKPDAADYLQALGASRVIAREEVQTKGRPLEKAVWGGAVDNVGGAMLAELLRTTRPWGSIASIGLAGGHELDTTVMPFILRGVSLLGITSANCPRARREQVWDLLGGDWRPQQLERMVNETVELDGLPDVFERMLAGQTRGRTVVRIGD